MTKSKNQNKYTLKIIIFLLISALLCSTFLFNDKLENWINNLIYPKISSQVDDCELKVHFIDVGQGDSILIELPDDKVMLVDSGPGKSEQKLVDYLTAFYNSRSDLDLDYFVITHQDEDHTGNADVVFDMLNVLNFYRPNVYTSEEIDEYGYSDCGVCNTSCYEDMIEKFYLEPNCEDFLTVGLSEIENGLFLPSNSDYNVRFLSPNNSTYSDANNYSPIMILEYMGRKIMLTGDAEKDVEDEVLALYSYDILSCDVLKLGHHGSSTSTSQDFLNAVNPSYAVISVGEGNSYGHPNETVVERVKTYVGEQVYRTDINGNIIFGVDKDSVASGKGEIKISTNKGAIITTYIHWWCVVVAFEGIVFIIIFIPKKRKNILKKLK